jgi:hypothetical protein
MKSCFDMKLEWSADDQYADFVCAAGAVFSNADSEMP